MVSEESSFDDPVGKPGTDFSFPTKSPGGRGSRISRYFKVSSNNDVPHPEHPRPLLQRQEWTNLNGCFSKRMTISITISVCVVFSQTPFPGLWDLAIIGPSDPIPSLFHTSIMVPFCVESALSGVGF